ICDQRQLGQQGLQIHNSPLKARSRMAGSKASSSVAVSACRRFRASTSHCTSSATIRRCDLYLSEEFIWRPSLSSSSQPWTTSGSFPLLGGNICWGKFRFQFLEKLRPCAVNRLWEG